MHASRESASRTPPRCDGAPAVMISGVNWLGDSVMTLPALSEWKRRHEGSRMVMLCKPGLVPFWKMVSWIDGTIAVGAWPAGAAAAAWNVRREKFHVAYVLTHSFRSALVPFLAGVPSRIGMTGHARDWMLTSIVECVSRPGREHQAFEYYDLMGMKDAADARFPLIPCRDAARETAMRQVESRLGMEWKGPLVGILPGAARGPSKVWPPGSFASLARRLVADLDCGIALFGSHAEKDICAEVVARSGLQDRITDFSGRTSLGELAALLSICVTVVANDSGGMHLAAAVGTPVIGLFGMTDHRKTGPLGEGHKIIAADSPGERSRDIKPDSPAARQVMASIKPESVFDAIVEIVNSGR